MAKPPASQGPGPVAGAHRLLIASALACAILYGLWEARAWTRGAGGGAALRAAAALAVAVGVAAYFRSLRGLDAKLTARDDRAGR